MSFLSGPECSTAGNPLTQFTKHVQNDNTLQRDRLVGRGPGGVEESFRSRQAPNGSDQVGALGAYRNVANDPDDERLRATIECATAIRYGADAPRPPKCSAND